MRKKKTLEKKQNYVEVRRDPKVTRRLFEHVAAIDRNAPNGDNNVYDFTAHYKNAFDTEQSILEETGSAYQTGTIFENSLSDYLQCLDAAKGLYDIYTNNGGDKYTIISNIKRLAMDSRDSITNTLLSNINKMIFDAYKSAIVKASDFMYTEAAAVLTPCTGYHHNNDQDLNDTLTALIKRCTDSFEKDIEDMANDIAKPYIGSIYSIPSAIYNDICKVIKDWQFSLLRSHYTEEEKRIRQALLILKMSMISSQLSMMLYDRVYFIISGHFLNNETALELMAMMDARGIFAQFHDTIINIMRYGIVKIEEYVNNNIITDIREEFNEIKPNFNDIDESDDWY